MGKEMIFVLLILAAGFILAACVPVQPAGADPVPVESPQLPAASPTPEAPTPTHPSIPTDTADPGSSPEANSISPIGCENPFGSTRLRFNTDFWPNTDFCKHSIDYAEVLSGGPPPDGIPAIDAPIFESVADGDAWIGDTWPVLYFERNDDARAYPLAILMWHEIVNDVVGGEPVTLTFCPLCNATIAFSRRLDDGTVLDFGTTGNLRNSDLIMYDRQTESWWQQFTGTSIVGDYTGTQLELLPSQIIAWEDFKANHPDGTVLSRDTGYGRNYGRNPYVGYDDINTNPFLFDGIVDGRLPATERIAAVELNSVWVAYPFSALEKVGVVNDDIGETPIVVFWQGNTTSALDTSDFDDARVVGSTAVFIRVLDGQALTFESTEGGFRDLETGSLWNIIGEATGGPLEGATLTQIVSAEHFWFAWAAFRPDTLIWTAEEG